MNKIKRSGCLLFLVCTQLLVGDLNVHTSLDRLNGDTISAWENFDVTENKIFASIQTGGTWNAATPISLSSTFPFQPKTAINASSNQMVVIWLGTDTVTFGQALFGSTYNGVTWDTVLLSDPLDEYVIGDHQVSISDTGVAVVTWSAFVFSAANYEARGIYAPTYGTWPAPVTLP